ncbi:MAG: winged helix-turn-helix domain-containing protein [Candidatus Bathyarchaeia archaeon]|jgi:predicted transcriptional regulator
MIFEGRRNHLQVLYDILQLCVKEPQAKTYILRNTNTSFKLLELYLLQLQASNLLLYQYKERKYSTTDEGRLFIEMWQKIRRLLNPQEPAYPISKNKLLNPPLVMREHNLRINRL